MKRLTAALESRVFGIGVVLLLLALAFLSIDR